MDICDTVTSQEQLSALYDAPAERVLLKVRSELDVHCRTLIAASPFCVLATSGPGGLDASPRGDKPGFIHVADDRTLILPDRRGNNRIDSLRNIVADPRMALIFLIPGMNETLRINGRAVISADPVLCAGYAVDGKAPRTVLVITVAEAFMQCARALMRSELWNPATFRDRASLPSAGEILAAHTRGHITAEAYDADITQRLPQTLY